MQSLRLYALLKHLSHSLYWCGFFPLWMYEWCCRLVYWIERLSHTLHWNVFSFVWILMWRFVPWPSKGQITCITLEWLFSFNSFINDCEHSCGASGYTDGQKIRHILVLNTLNVSLMYGCTYDVVDQLNGNKHWSHTLHYLCWPPAWIFMWRFRLDKHVKRLSHTLHW